MMASATVVHSGKQKRLHGIVGQRRWRTMVGDEVAYSGRSLRDAVDAYNDAG
jgi:pyrimidine operon attenuation protein/uracil phosphoribosyltransferase